MSITAIIPTDNPNVIRVDLDRPVPVEGTYVTFTSLDAVPEAVLPLLTIEGLSQVTLSDSSITLERDPIQDWDTILDEIRKSF